MTQDELYRTPIESLAQFCFDDKVAEVFNDMARRSIPLYADLMKYCAKIAERYYQNGSNIYDLGCSTGNTILAVRQRLAEAPIIGIDYSEAMICKAKEQLMSFGITAELEVKSLAEVEIKNASVVFLNYVLQFINHDQRITILKKIHDAMLPGSVLVFSEKVSASDATLEEEVTTAYYDFKRQLGYSEIEISQKRQALENFLSPISLNDNLELLKAAGFVKTEILNKLHSFVTIIAYR